MRSGIVKSSVRQLEHSTEIAFIVIISGAVRPARLALPGPADWEYVINKEKIIITGKIETFNWKNLNI